MLTQEQNRLLTHTGPGEPMGALLREYWVPAVRSAKLAADGAPVRVRMFGESFVAFRATDGRVGFLAEGCPHRRASLALARNEENGLRCIFHGWKFDVDGRCVDAPTEPASQCAAFAAKVPVRHHPVREVAGLVWVYLGAHKEPPPFPEFDFVGLPESHCQPARAIIHCNWLQGLEALLDSAHIGFLHRTGVLMPAQRAVYGSQTDLMVENTAPAFEIEQTPYGFREAALRQMPDGVVYARIREVVLPFFSFIPRPHGSYSMMVCSIPIDDEWTAQWYLPYHRSHPIEGEYLSRFMQVNTHNPDHFNIGMGDVSNLWHQDREAMRQGHYTGLTRGGNSFEDFIVQESMGPLVDRSLEYLSPVDVPIMRARRLLLRAVDEHSSGGAVAFRGPDIDLNEVRALAVTLKPGVPWRSVDRRNPADEAHA
jgi:phenylpropionate dioxygenase-like ring-hydroxylating dioxygenase large terminal subunit